MRIPRPRIFQTAVLAFASIAAFLGAVQASQSLPPIKSLPELKLELVLDLTDHPDVGLPTAGRISLRGEFVFYDARLRKVMIMPLDGRGVRAVGSFGMGPGEYQQVQDIRVDENGILVLDVRGRLIEYDWDGGLRRELKLPHSYERILGRAAEVFYLVGRSASSEAFFEKVVVGWREGDEAVALFKMNADVLRTQAIGPDGQVLAGGGLVTLSAPAFAFLGDGFAAAADARYRILFFDLSGKDQASWDLEAPKPEFFGRLFGSYSGKRPAYAIRDIFVLPGVVAVVGNFYRDGKPRLDCFNREGRLTSSWLIPLVCEAPFSRCQIEAGYLFHFSRDDGCRVFRIQSRL